MLVKCVNNIPSVKANAKKAYLFNEKAWWVDLADEWYVDTMAKWAVQQGFCGSVQRSEQRKADISFDIAPMPQLTVPTDCYLNRTITRKRA